jgi:hypothetical protein
MPANTRGIFQRQVFRGEDIFVAAPQREPTIGVRLLGAPGAAGGNVQLTARSKQAAND